jgi:hypothetical protein
MIKDSGTRRMFSSGAVRDIQSGKGRCDLMPLETLGEWMRSPFLRSLGRYKRTQNPVCIRTAFYDLVKEMYSDNYETACLEVSKHFEQGAQKYGENNWQKGIPVSCYLDSAVRHYLKWRRGDADEPHNRAAIWNILCCGWEIERQAEKDADKRK